MTNLPEDGNLDALLALNPVPSSANANSTASSARRMSESSDSGHDPNTFSDERGELHRTMSSLSGLTSVNRSPTHTAYSGAAAAADATASSSGSAAIALTPPLHTESSESVKSQSPYRMKAHEALQIGLILSQQEQQFGTNMYQALKPEDEPEIERLNSMGFSTEEAILKIFQRRYQPELLDHEVNSKNIYKKANYFMIFFFVLF